jgi:hypothetical protein
MAHEPPIQTAPTAAAAASPRSVQTHARDNGRVGRSSGRPIFLTAAGSAKTVSRFYSIDNTVRCIGGLEKANQQRETTDLRGEGSTPVPLPPPTLSVLRFLHGRDGRKSLNKVGPF